MDTRTISQGGGNYPIYLHDSIFHRCDSLRVVVEQDSLELCQRGEQTFRIEQGKKKHTLCMAINRNEDKTFPLQGTVFYLPPKKGGKTQKDTLFVDQAVVAYGNHVTITDQHGHFCIPLDFEEDKDRKLGCDYLTIYKKGFHHIQYEVNAEERYLFSPKENMSIDSIFNVKKEAVQKLYERMKPDSSITHPLTIDEERWMSTLAVLGNTKEDKNLLRTHQFYPIQNKDSIYFLSRKSEDAIRPRPVYGWVGSKEKTECLFEGRVTYIMDKKKWHMRITCQKPNLQTIEYFLVVVNPYNPLPDPKSKSKSKVSPPNVLEVWRRIPCADGKWRWECLKKKTSD